MNPITLYAVERPRKNLVVPIYKNTIQKAVSQDQASIEKKKYIWRFTCLIHREVRRILRDPNYADNYTDSTHYKYSVLSGRAPRHIVDKTKLTYSLDSGEDAIHAVCLAKDIVAKLAELFPDSKVYHTVNVGKDAIPNYPVHSITIDWS